MANTALTLSHLANIGAVVGFDMGFNACGVERYTDTTTFLERLSFTFGEQAEMKKKRIAVNDYALGYDDGFRCFRESRTVELPIEVIYGPADAIKDRLVQALLETIPSGPAGIRSHIFELVEP